MGETWRLIDTGLASPARNVALNRALLEARRADEIASTLRFLRCTRAVLLGYFQSAEQELDLAYCRDRAIVVQRRVTGGPAMYVDDRQLGWELYLHRREIGDGDMQRVAKRLCHAAATGLSALGVDARYRRRGEIEVDGRTLCTTGCAVDGGAILFQAVLLLDTGSEDIARFFRGPLVNGAPETRSGGRTKGLKALLRAPASTYRVREVLIEAFESEFGVEFSEGDLTLTEERRYEDALRAVDTPAWTDLVRRPASDKPIVEAVHEMAAGALRAAVAYDPSTSTIGQVWFSGDFSVNPARTIADLESALREVRFTRLAPTVESFFASHPADLGALTPADFITVVRLALRRPMMA